MTRPAKKPKPCAFPGCKAAKPRGMGYRYCEGHALICSSCWKEPKPLGRGYCLTCHRAATIRYRERLAQMRRAQ